MNSLSSSRRSRWNRSLTCLHDARQKSCEWIDSVRAAPSTRITTSDESYYRTVAPAGETSEWGIQHAGDKRRRSSWNIRPSAVKLTLLRPPESRRSSVSHGRNNNISLLSVSRIWRRVKRRQLWTRSSVFNLLQLTLKRSFAFWTEVKMKQAVFINIYI